MNATRAAKKAKIGKKGKNFSKFHLPDNTSSHETLDRKMWERKIRTELEAYFPLLHFPV